METYFSVGVVKARRCSTNDAFYIPLKVEETTSTEVVPKYQISEATSGKTLKEQDLICQIIYNYLKIFVTGRAATISPMSTSEAARFNSIPFSSIWTG